MGRLGEEVEVGVEQVELEGAGLEDVEEGGVDCSVFMGFLSVKVDFDVFLIASFGSVFFLCSSIGSSEVLISKALVEVESFFFKFSLQRPSDPNIL